MSGPKSKPKPNSKSGEKAKKKKTSSTKDTKKQKPEVVVIVSSSSDEVEDEAKSSNNSNHHTNDEALDDHHRKDRRSAAAVSNGFGGSCCFSANRIRKIIRSEGADFRTTQETMFLINKATEQFLEVLAEDVYVLARKDHQKAVNYEHLSSAVCKGRRYDFLSDFVPEKIKAEDALSERLAEA